MPLRRLINGMGPIFGVDHNTRPVATRPSLVSCPTRITGEIIAHLEMPGAPAPPVQQRICRLVEGINRRPLRGSLPKTHVTLPPHIGKDCLLTDGCCGFREPRAVFGDDHLNGGIYAMELT